MNDLQHLGVRLPARVRGTDTVIETEALPCTAQRGLSCGAMGDR